MKQYSKKLFSLVVLCGATAGMLHADDGNRVVPFLQWRSQGRDTARKLYGTTSYAVYQDDMDSTYGKFDVTVQYDQSFRGQELAECLFGNSLTSAPGTDCDDDDNILTISGELTTVAGAPALNTSRGKFDWMAENFYLPRDFKSTITFSPKVQDVVVDFNLYVGLDRWVKGMYFRLYGPVAWNKASLRPEETIVNKGTIGYETGFFDPDTAIAASSLFQSALSFFGGCQLPTYPALAPATTGQFVSVQPLNFAKWSGCNLGTSSSCDNDCGSFNHKTGFAELRGEFGWNYIQEKYRLGLNIQAAAPTGTRPNAEFLFPAQVGNGKHWELGGGFMGAWKMWSSEDGEKSFNFIVEADITHLFRAKQERTFDLKGKPNSRYMLAEKLVLTSSIPAAGQLTAASASVYQVDATSKNAGVYSPVANFSTQNCKVSIGAQGDVVAMFNYTVRGFSWDLGYNFWGMSKSKISLDSDNCDDGITPFPANTWALKGDASPYGYYVSGGNTLVVGLGATESQATIFSGTNAQVTGATLATTLTNNGVDAAVTPAVATGPNPLLVFGTPPAGVINTSVPAVLIAVTDLDVEGAEQRGISNKVFTHFSYTWTNRDKYVPYIGAGFSAEFGSHSNGDCSTSTSTSTTCPESVSCALSKWAVEIKGGVSFH
jgi:hypothetical protein